MAGIILLLMVGALAIIYVIDGHRTRRRAAQGLRVVESQWAFIHAADDFACSILEDHPELIRYDEELRILAERVALTREALHQAVHNNTSDGYQSPLRELLS